MESVPLSQQYLPLRRFRSVGKKPQPMLRDVLICAAYTVAMIAAVDPAVMPQATSLLYTFRSLGTTVGIALSSSLQQGA